MWRIVLIALLPQLVFTQVLPQIFQEYLEQNESVDENSLTLFFDLLVQPISLNTCSTIDLEQLPFLSHHQAQSIVNYRKEKGQFRTLYELQSINDLDLRIIKLLLPFVSISDDKSQSKKFFKHQLRFYMHRFLEEEQEYLNGDYVGDRYKNSVRYLAQSKGLNWGITTEKDGGEKWLDFNSIHANWTFKKSQIFVGDYQLSLGQGLLFFQGFSFGKSSQVSQVFKNSPVLRSHTSTRENHFLRGLSLQHQLKKFNFFIFLSSKKQDANVKDSIETVTSIQDLGLHRTRSELDDKSKIHHHLVGSCLEFRQSKLKTSIYSMIQQWNKNLIFGNDTLSRLWAMGWDYSLTLKNTHFFGECDLQQGALAILSGFNSQLASDLSFSSIYRNYSPNYYAYESNAFGEQSNTRNEKGLYSSISLDVNSKWNLSFYSDVYLFPQQSYYSDAPLKGRDYFFQIKYKVRKKWQAYARCQYESKMFDSDDTFGLKEIRDRNQLRFTLEWKYKLSDFNFKNRIAWNRLNEEKGFLMLYEINYKPLENPWGVSLRYLLFDTPTYASRIYVYEPDVMYAFSVPSHFGEGQRIGAVVKYKIKRLTFNLKLAQTLYHDRTLIKSGSVEGNKLTEVKLAMRWVF